jgi:hypothetical protein
MLVWPLRLVHWLRVSQDDEICGLDFKYHNGYIALDFNRRVELAKQKMEREKIMARKMEMFKLTQTHQRNQAQEMEEKLNGNKAAWSASGNHHKHKDSHHNQDRWNNNNKSPNNILRTLQPKAPPPNAQSFGPMTPHQKQQAEKQQAEKDAVSANANLTNPSHTQEESSANNNEPDSAVESRKYRLTNKQVKQLVPGNSAQVAEKYSVYTQAFALPEVKRAAPMHGEPSLVPSLHLPGSAMLSPQGMSTTMLGASPTGTT